jgi:AAA+ ATPase superfamily predicted ATPase
MKYKLDNPFAEYGYFGPEYFCDREQETEELMSALQNGSNVTLIAPRRIGKTGLIHHAFARLKEQQPQV